MTSSGELDSRYKVRSPLRCDGVGALHCGEDTSTGARVAIRWLPIDANGPTAIEKIRSLPDHPVLPKILATGQNPSAAFLAMDFPEGLLLSARESAMGGDALSRLGWQVASALTALHEAGTVHGELS